MVKDKIIELIQNTFNNSEVITLDTTPNDVDEWDSLGHIMLIQSIEEKFSVSFDFNEMLNLESVKDIVEIVNNKVTNL